MESGKQKSKGETVCSFWGLARGMRTCLVTEQENPKVEQILEAARKLFLEQSYDTVSTDQIAKVAKVSKATLYVYFPSKEKLFETLVTQHCRATAQNMSREIDLGEDVEIVLGRIARNFLAMFANPDALALCRTVIGQATRFPELGRMFHETGPRVVKERVGAFLAEATRRGDLDVPDPQLAAAQFLQLVAADVPITSLLGVRTADLDQMDETVESGIAMFLARYGRKR